MVEDSAQFPEFITFTKDEVMDLAGALWLAAQALRASGDHELAHRLNGQIDMIEDRLLGPEDEGN
jgi:hypothetical protein